MSYDTKCYDLANEMLDVKEYPFTTTNHVRKLAQGIQDYIEDFLGDLEYDRRQELEASKDEAIDRKMDERWSDRDEWKHEAAEQQRLK